MKIFIFTLPLYVILTSAFGIAERDFHSKNGQVIRGSIVSYEGEGDILLRRSSDLQLFRVSLDIFTEDDQAFVKNNFPPDHKKLPEFPRPLNDRALAINAKAIDDLVISKLRSYNQRENKIAGDEVFLRRAYLKIMGRIPTLSETKDFLDDKDKTGKRKNLIDKLLLTEGYVSNWFHYWACLLYTSPSPRDS